ncbi:MAG: hypothetical protein DIJKHBIC_04799 [Thermoanaerobaculia bacterium]|nr:hypothetical protein [Thermoanaerobaculia bacterium]
MVTVPVVVCPGPGLGFAKDSDRTAGGFTVNGAAFD